MKALVLFSGGQDSTTCLFWAKREFKEVVALNIAYGQRHFIEITSASQIADIAKIPLIKLSFGNLFQDIGDSALVIAGDISANHRSSRDLPASFVPGRNIILISVAAAVAYKYDIKHIVTGVCHTDFSGYPDCRDNAIKSLGVTLSLGFGADVTIHTPLMWLTKAESVRLAQSLPGCMEVLSYSHTCYEGEVPPCGKCLSCKIRAKGFAEAGVKDPLVERWEKHV